MVQFLTFSPLPSFSFSLSKEDDDPLEASFLQAACVLIPQMCTDITLHTQSQSQEIDVIPQVFVSQRGRSQSERRGVMTEATTGGE